METAESMALELQLREHRQKVDVDHYDISVREVIGMASRRELHIAPIYQRKFRWKESDESRLIESILLGLPVPSVYVATNPDGTWEVVDGLQRLSSLIHFVADPIKILEIVDRKKPLYLSDLDKLSSFNGKTYTDLPLAMQLSFKSRMLRLTALSDKSEPNVRFDMFERLNTGGIALTAQEVRTCVYTGPFILMLNELAEHESFQALLKLNKGNQKDGTRQELVLKYFAYSRGREKFDGKVTEFLNSYAKNEGPILDTIEAKAEFIGVCELLFGLIEGPILRKSVAVTPLNLAEAVLVSAGELIHEKRKANPKKNWLNDAELVFYSSKGTNTRSMLRGRLKRAKELLEGHDVKSKFT